MRCFAASLTLAFMCCALGAQVTTLRVGAVTAIPGLFDPLKPALEKELGIHLTYKEESGVDLLTDVEAGALDVAVAGISMEGWLDAMKAKGRPVKPIESYDHRRIGTDRLSVLVSPDVVSDATALAMDLDREQIKGLFTGRIRNWKELGGPDLPVVVLVSRIFVTTAKAFRDGALDGQPIVEGHGMIEGGIYDIAKALCETKGAITFGPLGLTGNTRIWSPAQAPKIERPFTLVVSPTLDPARKKTVEAMIAFINGPGQAILAK